MAKRQGSGARARAKEKRRALKRARKEAMRAQFATWAGTAQNKKKAKGSAGSSSGIKHPQPFCGNLGCAKCHLKFSNPWHALENSCLYSKRFTSSKWRNFAATEDL